MSNFLPRCACPDAPWQLWPLQLLLDPSADRLNKLARLQNLTSPFVKKSIIKPLFDERLREVSRGGSRASTQGVDLCGRCWRGKYRRFVDMGIYKAPNELFQKLTPEYYNEKGAASSDCAN